MSNISCIHCHVSGKVQGVWFRASTKKYADDLGVTGWVRNLPDGRVEVMACGDSNLVEQLYLWLQHGPAIAKVTQCTREDAPIQTFRNFEVL